MLNSEWYYRIVQRYREDLDGINSKFDLQIETKKRYAGSAGYSADIEKIEKERAEEIAALRADCRESFAACINLMRKKANARTAVPPTQEQLALIQLLKMKEHVTRQELEHAANTMGECSLGRSVLEEIARKNEILGFHAGGGGISDRAVEDFIRALDRSAGILLTLDRTGRRRELLSTDGKGEGPHGTHPGMANIRKFRVDVSPKNAQDAAAKLGGVPADLYKAFSGVVDGKEGVTV